MLATVVNNALIHMSYVCIYTLHKGSRLSQAAAFLLCNRLFSKDSKNSEIKGCLTQSPRQMTSAFCHSCFYVSKGSKHSM